MTLNTVDTSARGPAAPSSPCWFCGGDSSPSFAALSPGGRRQFTYLRCRGCGLATLAEGPDRRNLDAFYATDYELGSAEFAHGRRSLLSRLRAANFHRMARKIEAMIGKGRILDVGCGSGVFLAALRERGWDVAGVEPHLTAARQLRAHHGIEVHVGTLEEASTDWGSFDAASLLDVLEHLPDPVLALQKVWSLLRPGGVLIVTTPNVDSFEHRLFGRHWYALQPPDHLWLFSSGSLEQLVTRSGFDRLLPVTSPVSYTWPSLCGWMGVRAGAGPADAAMKALAAPPVSLIAQWQGAPAQLELYARRPG